MKTSNLRLRIILIVSIVILGLFTMYEYRWQSLFLTAEYQYKFPIEEVIINQQEVETTSTLILIGHAYGDPGLENTLSPAQTLADSVENINALEPGLVVLLGDVAKTSSLEIWQSLDERLLSQLNAPVLIAPGNHDLENRALYEQVFGQTFYYTQVDNNLMIVLDSILNSCHIVGNQKKMLAEAIKFGQEDEEINHILIFSHNLISVSKNNPVARYVNRRCFTSNYDFLLEKYFKPVSESKPVYIFSGDVGAFGGGRNLSPYYYKEPDAQVFNIAVGLGNGLHDSILLANLEEAQLSFEIISLQGQATLPLESYTPSYYLDVYSSNQ